MAKKLTKPIRNVNIEEKLRTLKRTPELEKKIKEAAYLLSNMGLTYDDLCWFYAETQLKIQKGVTNVSESEIKKKAEEVNKLVLSYEDLCWRFSELSILIKNFFFKV